MADWQRPGFVVEESTVGVLDPSQPGPGGAARLVGYAEVGPHGRCDAAVDPGRDEEFLRQVRARAEEQRARHERARREREKGEQPPASAGEA